MQAQNLPGSQTTLQHQQYDRSVTLAAQLRQQSSDLGLTERPRDALHRLDPHRAADRPLPAGPAHERPVPL